MAGGDSACTASQNTFIKCLKRNKAANATHGDGFVIYVVLVNLCIGSIGCERNAASINPAETARTVVLSISICDLPVSTTHKHQRIDGLSHCHRSRRMKIRLLHPRQAAHLTTITRIHFKRNRTQSITDHVTGTSNSGDLHRRFASYRKLQRLTKRGIGDSLINLWRKFSPNRCLTQTAELVKESHKCPIIPPVDNFRNKEKVPLYGGPVGPFTLPREVT